MPEKSFDIDELLERIVLLDKIKKGEKDILDGNVFTTLQAKEKLSKWLK